MTRSIRRTALFTVMVMLATVAPGDWLAAQTPAPLWSASFGNWTVAGLFQGGLNAVSETDLFWNLADVPELDFDSDPQWLESYAKPGLLLRRRSESGSALYAKLSLVASYTNGIDAFDTGNTGRVTLEEAHAGYLAQFANGTRLDVSVGAREWRLGTGMLVANGGVSGFERGALKFGPRKAWEMAAIADLQRGDARGTLFYLDANELDSNNTGTRLAGADFSVRRSADRYLGFSYLRVVDSDAPWPQAGAEGQGPPVITPGAREDLSALQMYARARPFDGRWSGLTVGVDAAYQWNPSVDQTGWGGRLQLGYDFRTIAWTPTLAASYQIFSGDDPETSELERFDPLYYEGSPSAWSTGSKSSMVFINSNVQAAGASLRVVPTQRDIFTLRYSYIAAHRLRSPLQFGQAARVDFSDGEQSTVVSGVTMHHVADDLFLEYNRVVSANIFVNAGVSVSVAGAGIQSIVGSTTNWSGAYLNVVVNY